MAAGPGQSPPGVGTTNLLGGRFELGARVGGRGTGAVHRAVDTQTQTIVAVKLVAPAVAAGPGGAQRVEHELKLLERVDHPAIARVIASGRDGEQLWFAMEWLEGVTPLTGWVPPGGLDAQRAAELVLIIGRGLIEAAKAGVIHRDLSPENLVFVNGALKVINFAVPVPGAPVPGAPSFVSPETIEGKAADQLSSIYSLGAVYYYLLTGAPPFSGDAAAIYAAQLSGGFVPPSQRAAVPGEIEGLVRRAMERKPNQRFLTLQQFLDDLERVKNGGGAAATSPMGRQGKAPKVEKTYMGLAPQPDGPTGERAPVSPHALAAAAGAGGLPAGAPTLKQIHAVAEPSAAPAAAAMVAAQPYAAGPAPAMAAAAAAQPASVAVAAAPKAAASRSTSSSATGKKKSEARDRRVSMGKFRETLWFKKGDLDVEAAVVAATDKEGHAPDKADLLPIEERYGDDGSITAKDAERYSLKTGGTAMMPAMKNVPLPEGGGVSERELIIEMKRGRRKVIGLILAGVVAVAVITILFVAM